MKLKRYPWSSSRTAGRWKSADGHWDFDWFPFGWLIGAHPYINTGLVEERRAFLSSTGLNDHFFKTRREAIAALELALAGAPELSCA